MQKLTTEIVKNNDDKTFVFEDLTNIKKKGKKKKKNKKNNNSKAKGKEPNKSKRFRTYINR